MSESESAKKTEEELDQFEENLVFSKKIQEDIDEIQKKILELLDTKNLKC